MATQQDNFRIRYGLDVGNKINAATSVSAYASLNLPHGTAPSSPVNGDVWTTTTGLYARINGTSILMPSDSLVVHLAGTETITGTKTFTSDETDWDSSTSAKPRIRIINRNTDASAGIISFRHLASDNSLSDGDLLGSIDALGILTGGGTGQSAHIQFKADGANSATAVAGKIVFRTIDSSNTGGDRLTITSSLATFSTAVTAASVRSDSFLATASSSTVFAFDTVSTGTIYIGPSISSGVLDLANNITSGQIDIAVNSGNTATVSIGDSGTSIGIYGSLTLTKTLLTATPTTSLASIRLPHGTAPTSPTNGDVWTTTAGAFMRINGLTVPIAGHIQSDTAPTPAYNGLLWTDTVSGGTFEYYDSFWVEVGSAGGQLIAPVTITGTVAASVPLTVKGASSQSSNFFEIKDSSNTILLSLDSTGGLNVPTGPIKPRAGTTGEPPMQFTSGTNLTTAVGGGVEYDGKTVYITPDTAAVGGRAINDMSIMVTSIADLTLTNGTGVQSLFTAANDTLTNAAGSTTYEFECEFFQSGTGTTSHTLNFAIGGTATLTAITYQAYVAQNATGLGTPTPTAHYSCYLATAASTAITAATATAIYRAVRIRGIIRVNAAGTLIPQVAFSAAPGAAPVIKAGAKFRMRPLGSNGSAIVVGAWA